MAPHDCVRAQYYEKPKVWQGLRTNGRQASGWLMLGCRLTWPRQIRRRPTLRRLYKMSSVKKYSQMMSVYQTVVQELSQESDRGCVVLAFAWLDEQLTKNLQKYLLPTERASLKSDELLGAGRPLGDASTKIDLSLRLGILQPNTHESLHLIRRLRNDFAHLSQRITFDTPNIRDRVLAILDRERGLIEALWESMVSDPEVRRVTEESRGKSGYEILRDVLGTKRLFILATGAVVAGLVSIEHSLAPVKPPARVGSEA